MNENMTHTKAKSEPEPESKEFLPFFLQSVSTIRLFENWLFVFTFSFGSKRKFALNLFRILHYAVGRAGGRGTGPKYYWPAHKHFAENTFRKINASVKEPQNKTAKGERREK